MKDGGSQLLIIAKEMPKYVDLLIGADEWSDVCRRGRINNMCMCEAKE